MRSLDVLHLVRLLHFLPESYTLSEPIFRRCCLGAEFRTTSFSCCFHAVPLLQAVGFLLPTSAWAWPQAIKPFRKFSRRRYG